MIEINLLPEELRRKKTEPAFSLDMGSGKMKILAAGGAAGILVLIVIAFFLGTSIRNSQIDRLLAKEKNFSARFSRVDNINKEIALLRSKTAVLDQLTKRKFLWAEKLNRLSDLALPGIWFTHVYTDAENRLIIEGSVISKSEEAMAFVGKFMKNVKDDQGFFRDFKSVKLESVQRKSKGERDVVDFKIALYFI